MESVRTGSDSDWVLLFTQKTLEHVEHLEHAERLERSEHLERAEHLEHLEQRSSKDRRFKTRRTPQLAYLQQLHIL